MEYDPADYPSLLEPLIQGKADVVYGSRFLGSRRHRVLYFWHSVGNWLLTLLSNCLNNVKLSDMETCYKVFRREIIQAIPVEEDRFGFAPEITVKVYEHQLLGSHLLTGQEDWLEGRFSLSLVLVKILDQRTGRTRLCPAGLPRLALN